MICLKAMDTGRKDAGTIITGNFNETINRLVQAAAVNRNTAVQRVRKRARHSDCNWLAVRIGRSPEVAAETAIMAEIPPIPAEVRFWGVNPLAAEVRNEKFGSPDGTRTKDLLVSVGHLSVDGYLLQSSQLTCSECDRLRAQRGCRDSLYVARAGRGASVEEASFWPEWHCLCLPPEPFTWCRDRARVRPVSTARPKNLHTEMLACGRISEMKTASHTATLSLIPSFGACTRSCFVPR